MLSIHHKNIEYAEVLPLRTVFCARVAQIQHNLHRLFGVDVGAKGVCDENLKPEEEPRKSGLDNYLLKPI